MFLFLFLLRLPRLFLPALIAFALAPLLSVSAEAHASLVRSEPADGAVMEAAPESFSLTFTDPVAPQVLTLIAPDGRSTPLDGGVLEGNTLRLPMPPDLSVSALNGTYVLNFRIVSEDGHPVGGSILFSIGAPSATAAENADVGAQARDPALWAARTILYLALFLGAGGLAARAWLFDGSAPGATVTTLLALAGLPAASLSVGLQGLDALGRPLADLTDPAVWATGYATSYGRTVTVAVLALLLALATLAADRKPRRALATLTLAATGLALALSGHASAAAPQMLMRPAVFVHAVTVAVWIGALLPLGIALSQGHAGAATALRRFSSLIPWALAALIVAGSVLAAVQLGTPGALVSTDYGKVLLAKLALVAALLLVALANRVGLTRPARSGDRAAARSLARMIAVETLLVVLVFGLVALWRFTPPPRALEAAAAASPAWVHIHGEKAMAEVTLTPGRAGASDATIVLIAPDFGPLEARQVDISLANPAAGIERLTRRAERMTDGRWLVPNLLLPAAGRWTLETRILISDFEMARIEGEIEIRP